MILKLTILKEVRFWVRIKIVQIDIWRGVEAQNKQIRDEEENINERNDKASQDQGGKVADSHTSDQIEEINEIKQKEERKSKLIESPLQEESKFVGHKFTSNYDTTSDNLDGSTVLIADWTPSQEEIEKEVPPSPMIDKKTKDKLKQLGQSLDSKQISQAIGNIDMRRLWKCFSKAICKHIEFSEGFLFLEDLKSVTNQIYAEHGIPEESINFSYGQGKELKISMQGKKIGKEEKEIMKKEGEVNKNLNFDQLAGIFENKNHEGKVFEYHEQQEELKGQNPQLDDKERDIEDNIDYSHEHLEEFMKSLSEHNQNQNFKQALGNEEEKLKDFGNSTLNPSQADVLITDFLQNVSNNEHVDTQTVDKGKMELLSKRDGSRILSIDQDKYTGRHTGATLSNSLAYSQSNASVVGMNQFNSVSLVSGNCNKRETNEDSKLEEIKIDSTHKHHLTEQIKWENEEDDLERDDEIIDVGSLVSKKEHNIESKTEREPIIKDHASYSDGMKIMNQDLNTNINPNLLDQSNLFESQEVLIDKENKDTFKDYIETQMFLFHFNFDFESDGMILDENGDIPSFPFLEYKPTEEEVYYYCKYVVLACKMEKEIPLMALVYIERFMTQTGMLLNHWNWRRVVLVVLLTASKVWDDDSLENIHFPQVMPDITLKEVNNLERIFLELIDYKLQIRGAGRQ